MKAMFSTVKDFAIFNSKPHLFSYGDPYQLGSNNVNDGVFIEYRTGSKDQFISRVEQFGGVVIDSPK